MFTYIIECAALNAYIIQKHGLPPSEQQKYDYLDFRFALAEELIGSFSSRASSVGRHRSSSHQQELRLDKTKSHLPVAEGPKRDCIVCTRIGQERGLPRNQYRHGSLISCSECQVHLCVRKDRNCFLKYHTLPCFWQ